MREAGIELKGYGIRLDSGDLAYFSKKARKMLDDAGFEDAIISASSDLDEYLIDSLKTQGAAITSWGVGTNLITAKDNPAFGGVYKLAAVMGDDGKFIPKIKLSENSEKITNPGNKTVYRVYDTDGMLKADLIALTDETYDENEPLLLFDPIETWKKRFFSRVNTLFVKLSFLYSKMANVYTQLHLLWIYRNTVNMNLLLYGMNQNVL